MSLKRRMIILITGIAFTAVGALLVYYELFEKNGQWYGNSSYFPYGTLITGIVLILWAFEKKKKELPDDKNDNTPNQNTGA